MLFDFDFMLIILGANSTRVYGAEYLYDALENRPQNQPLITVLNHHSCMDEPLIHGNCHFLKYTYNN